jgi:hypothetical protein
LDITLVHRVRPAVPTNSGRSLSIRAGVELIYAASEVFGQQARQTSRGSGSGWPPGRDEIWKTMTDSRPHAGQRGLTFTAGAVAADVPGLSMEAAFAAGR